MSKGVGFAAHSVAIAATRSAAVKSSIAAIESSIAIVGWGWEAKGRQLGVGGEGSVVEERGSGEGKMVAKAKGRPNRRRAEAASWIGCDDGLGEAAVRERVREREERVRELKSKIDSKGTRE